MFGGRRPGKRGWGATGKNIVFGIYPDAAKCLLFLSHPVLKRLCSLTLTDIPKLEVFIIPMRRFAYAFLSVGGNHVVVLKEKGISKGRDHINGIEGFWSAAKHCLYHYRGISSIYFPLYLKELEWKFNHRNENLFILLRKLLNQQNFIVKEQI